MSETRRDSTEYRLVEDLRGETIAIPVPAREQVHLDPDIDPVDAFLGGFKNGWASRELYTEREGRPCAGPTPYCDDKCIQCDGSCT